MVAAQHLHGRHVDQKPAARLRHPVHFANRRVLDRVGQGIQYVEGSDDIERGVGKGDRTDGSAREPLSAGRSTKFQAAGGEVEAECQTESPEQVEIVARAATTVEQSEIGPVGCCTFEKWRDEVAETAKPEMALFGGRCRTQQVIHRFEL